MSEYLLSLTHMFPYEEQNLKFCHYTGTCETEENRILAYFCAKKTQKNISITFKDKYIIWVYPGLQNNTWV